MPSSGQEAMKPPTSLKARLNSALLSFSSDVASVKSGALVQVWMPEQCADGTVVLSAQGLPFCVVGVGDLLALFRCVSVRYRFSTDVTRPALMGAIGRVFATMEPEMSHDVQKYDKQVYLRVSEAQRCRVHSTLVVPIFESGCTDKPLAVFELVQADRDVTFPAVINWLSERLQAVSLSTVNVEQISHAAGLRKWPMHVDVSGMSGGPAGSGGKLKSPPAAGGGSQQGAGTGSAGQSGKAGLGPGGDPGGAKPMVEGDEVTSEVTVHAGDKDGPAAASPQGAQQGVGSRLDRLSSDGQSRSNQQEGGGAASSGAGDSSGAAGTALKATAAAPGANAAAAAAVAAAAAAAGGADGVGGSKDAQLMHLVSLISTNGVTPAVLQSLKALISNGAIPSTNPALAAVASTIKQEPTTAKSSAPAASSALAPQASGKGAGASRGTNKERGEGDKDTDDDISSGGEEDDSDDEGGGGKANNRVGGGAGKRLRLEDLQAQFGLGLKDAAANLGICATTLKRACRRHGIKRWPRRQIVKLSKALNQMGYQGVPPNIVHTAAIAGAAGGAGAAGPAAGGGSVPQADPAAAAAAAAAVAAAAAAAPQQQHQHQQQLAVLLAASAQAAAAATAPKPVASGPDVPLHPLLAAFNQQAAAAPSAAQQQQLQMLAGQLLASGQLGPQQAAALQGMMAQPGGMGMAMMNPLLMQHMGAHGGMGMMGHGGMAMMMPPGMQQAFMQQQQQMQQASMMGSMGSMGPPQTPQQQQMQQQASQGGPPQPPMPPPQSQQQGSGMQQQQQLGQGPPQPQASDASSLQQQMAMAAAHHHQQQGGFMPMHFLYGNGMGSRSTGPPLVNELLDASGGGGSSVMRMNSSAMQTSNKELGGVFDMHCSSTFTIPTAELLHGVDTSVAGLAGHHQAGAMGLSMMNMGMAGNDPKDSQAQIAAVHDMFRNGATGSLENFMDMLSDDLPVIH